jgi:site-specific DNA-methyltransferase (adenine-specific)
MTGWVTNKLNGSQLPTAEQWGKICNLFGIENEYDGILNRVKRITYNLELDDTDIICSNKGKAGSLGHLSSESKRDSYTQTKTGYPKSILKYDRETGLHPTQKPVALMEFLINTYSNEGELVVDNCMGSGTSGVACKKTGRNFIGIENDAEHFTTSVSRVSAYCG